MNTQERLMGHACSKCLPFLLETPQIRMNSHRLAVVLVGSVATGQCRDGSDIDIAIMGSKESVEPLSEGTHWSDGRPTETVIDGVQLHYYGVSFEEVEQRLRRLDDAYFYTYGSAVVLHDPSELFRNWANRVRLRGEEIFKDRVEGRLDMLVRRTRALEQALQARDRMNIAGIGLEVVSMSLRLTALLDGIPFNPRKRLFEMALRGPLGKRIEPSISGLLSSVGAVGSVRTDEDFSALEIGGWARQVAEALSVEANQRGYVPRRLSGTERLWTKGGTT